MSTFRFAFVVAAVVDVFMTCASAHSCNLFNFLARFIFLYSYHFFHYFYHTTFSVPDLRLYHVTGTACFVCTCVYFDDEELCQVTDQEQHLSTSTVHVSSSCACVYAPRNTALRVATEPCTLTTRCTRTCPPRFYFRRPSNADQNPTHP